jgi:hypothetical protein
MRANSMKEDHTPRKNPGSTKKSKIAGTALFANRIR